jgi:hypothetical protein
MVGMKLVLLVSVEALSCFHALPIYDLFGKVVYLGIEFRDAHICARIDPSLF